MKIPRITRKVDEMVMAYILLVGGATLGWQMFFTGEPAAIVRDFFMLGRWICIALAPPWLWLLYEFLFGMEKARQKP
jgi:hypothetical protein